MAIAVRSDGMWTDRIATEIDERVTGKHRVALAKPLGELGAKRMGWSLSGPI